MGYRHYSLSEVLHSIIHFPHTIPHALLFLERLMELQHIEVRHKQEVIHRRLLQSLHDEVVHIRQVIEEKGRRLIQEYQCWVQLMQSNQRFEYGRE